MEVPLTKTKREIKCRIEKTLLKRSYRCIEVRCREVLLYITCFGYVIFDKLNYLFKWSCI